MPDTHDANTRSAPEKPDDPGTFDETALPDDVSVEDALQGFMAVDPEAVKEAEKAKKDDPDGPPEGS